jgi:Mrp family chromosome partitioning ATPase
MPQQESGPNSRQDATIRLNGSSPFEPTIPVGTNGSPASKPAGGLGSTHKPENNSRPLANPEKAAGLPLDATLTHISHAPSWQEGRGVANSETMEYFRRIYLSLQPPNSPDTMPTIGVTSALDSEGKSTIALGIASAMAADLDCPIVLVELNLSRPVIHKNMGLPLQPGLSEYLRGECMLTQALRQINENLFVLPAGDCRNDPARLIRRLTRTDLLLRMDNSGAVLVLDLPPVLTASYGVLASSMADAVVLVVRSGHTPEAKVKEAIARLDESTLRGMVLNAARPSIPTWLGGYL